MRVRLFGILVSLLVFGAVASAQSVIYNAPTTDTVEKGKTYVEGVFSAKFKDYSNGGFQQYGFRTVYGLDRRTEIGANFYVTRDGSGDLPREVQFNFKRSVYHSEKLGVAVSGGALVNVPLTKSAGSRPTSIIYGVASKSFERTGTRLTGGAYRAIARKRDFGKMWGFTAGFEQKIGKRFSVIGDWFSGSNRYGYAFVGMNIAVTKRQFLSFGYNFGNTGDQEDYFSVSYGIYF